MKRILLTSMALIASMTVACSHHKTKVNAGDVTATTDPKGLQGELEWYKNRGDTLEFLITLTNNSKSSVSFKRSSINMTFNGAPVGLTKDNFSGDMGPGTSEKAVLAFRFVTKDKRAGTAVITFDPIQVAGSGDGEPQTLPPLKMTVAINK